MTDKQKAAAGRKGGLKTGPTKNRMAHLTAEERSQRMRDLVKKRYEKK